MEGSDVARGCNREVSSASELAIAMQEDEGFLRYVAKLYFKDHLYGTHLTRAFNITFEEFNEILDDDIELANRFSNVVGELASAKIERNVDVGIAQLIDSLSRSVDDINSLRIIQSSIQTLSTIKRTYEKNPLKAGQKLGEFERILAELGG